MTDTVLSTVHQLARELHPGRRGGRHLTLRSSLHRDLGIDSLARAELLLRLERVLGVRLPEHGVAKAETPGELLALLLDADVALSDSSAPAAPAAETGDEILVPEGATTLVELVQWHAEHQPERIHLKFYDEQARSHPLTFGGLYDGARRVAASFLEDGLEPGQTVALMLPSGLDYFQAFIGILLAGGIPVPLYPPVRPSQVEDHLRRQQGILECAEARGLVTTARIKPLASLLRAQVGTLRKVITTDELLAVEPASPASLPAVGPEKIAFIQFTSGSTGQPKGVALTHLNLLTNLRVMGEAIDAGREVMVSWLPLYHDMGLIGAWMGSLYHAFDLVLLSPLSFLTRPALWLQTLSLHRGTVSAAPNFAYELCLTKIDDREMEGVDLASWRLALNGAEAVSPLTLDRFAERFARWGFRREALLPVYGLAESSVGVTFPPPGRGPRFDRVRREALQRQGRLEAARPEETDTLTFVSCGFPFAEHEIRVVDEAGRELEERREGRLQFRGPSATAGYYRNPEATAQLFDGEWLESGDLAYLADGEVFITGRAKDLIIRAGLNLYPHEIEEAIGQVPGVRRGCVAVFGGANRSTGTEKLIVLAETREEEESSRDAIRRGIHETVADLTAVAPDHVILAPPRTVLKTSSGKIRRSACRELYERDEIGRRVVPVWVQLSRVAGRGVLATLRRVGRRTIETGYAARVWSAVGFMAVVALPVVMLLPGLPLRRRAARIGCRRLFRLAGVPLRVDGYERLPPRGPCVLAVNHASYADGLLLTAALPPNHAYLAKRELEEHPVTRFVLRRLGAHFVERFDAERGALDARKANERAMAGEVLVFFAEGTFRRAPGLLPFRLGAFQVAHDVGCPAVPVAIRGSRTLLRGDTFFPRRSQIEIEIGMPVLPDGEGWEGMLRLRDRVREVVLSSCGEPDAR